jgi:para-nitrobenzyl esterase
MYLFTWETPVNGGRMLAHHALELTFVIDDVVKVPAVLGGGPEAAALAGKMSPAWLAFARTGDPNMPEVPPWGPYTPPERATMVFDNRSMVVSDPHREIRQPWATM